MAENEATPPLPIDTPMKDESPPPLPPSEPVPQSKSSKRLGTGDGDGTESASIEPPVKKTRRNNEDTLSNDIDNVGKGSGRKKLKATSRIGESEAEVGTKPKEDGELEDDSGDDSTYLVIGKKNRNKKAQINNIGGEDSGVSKSEGGGETASTAGSSTAATAPKAAPPGDVGGASAEVKIEASEKADDTVSSDGNDDEAMDDDEYNGGEEHITEDFDSALTMYPQEFAIIDDLEDSDDEDNQEDVNEPRENEESDSDLDEEEIENMLEEDFEKRKDIEERDFFIREKEILVERPRDPFDILPEFWVKVTHNSGVPLYLHKKTRVCTLGRPYFLGRGSTRNHSIPMSAIPCMNYKNSLKESFGIPGNNIPEFCDPKSLLLTNRSKAESEAEKQALKTDKLMATWEKVKVIEQLKCGVARLAASHTDTAEGDKQLEDEHKPFTDMIAKIQEDINELAALCRLIGPGSKPTTTAGCEADATAVGSNAKPTTSAEGEADATTADATKDTATDDKPEQSSQKNATPELNDVAAKESDDKTPPKEGVTETKMEEDSESTEKATDKTTAESEQSKEDANSGLGNVKIASVEEHKERSLLRPEQIREYCTRLFHFKRIYVKRFKSWKVRRAYYKAKNNPHRPTLPEGTKLIMCPMAKPDLPGVLGGNKKKEFMLNPKGKSEICILHEYAQHSMRVQPKYIFEETANALKPYSATITINDIKYGCGTAVSKKAAKAAAAHETLKILIPEVLKMRDPNSKEALMLQDMAFFDDVKIEDPRVVELSTKAGEPMPFEILKECLKRNFGMGDTNLTVQMRMVRPQRSEFTMKVASYEAKVFCKSKRDGKQRAAQAILQQMHPLIVSWGSLLRLYARDISAQQEMKAEDCIDKDTEDIIERILEELTSVKDIDKPSGLNGSETNWIKEEAECDIKNEVGDIIRFEKTGIKGEDDSSDEDVKLNPFSATEFIEDREIGKLEVKSEGDMEMKDIRIKLELKREPDMTSEIEPVLKLETNVEKNYDEDAVKCEEFTAKSNREKRELMIIDRFRKVCEKMTARKAGEKQQLIFSGRLKDAVKDLFPKSVSTQYEASDVSSECKAEAISLSSHKTVSTQYERSELTDEKNMIIEDSMKKSDVESAEVSTQYEGSELTDEKKTITEDTVKKSDVSSQYEGAEFVSCSSQQTYISFVKCYRNEKAAAAGRLKSGSNPASPAGADSPQTKGADEEVARILNKCVSEGRAHVLIPSQFHKVTQTDHTARGLFHKATQFPDHDYVPKEDDRTIVPKVNPSVCNNRMAGALTQQQGIMGSVMGSGLSNNSIYYQSGMSLMQQPQNLMTGYGAMYPSAGVNLNLQAMNTVVSNASTVTGLGLNLVGDPKDGNNMHESHKNARESCENTDQIASTSSVNGAENKAERTTIGRNLEGEHAVPKYAVECEPPAFKPRPLSGKGKQPPAPAATEGDQAAQSGPGNDDSHSQEPVPMDIVTDGEANSTVEKKPIFIGPQLERPETTGSGHVPDTSGMVYSYNMAAGAGMGLAQQQQQPRYMMNAQGMVLPMTGGSVQSAAAAGYGNYLQQNMTNMYYPGQGQVYYPGYGYMYPGSYPGSYY